MKIITDELALKLWCLDCKLIKYIVNKEIFLNHNDAEYFCKSHGNKLFDNSFWIDDNDNSYTCYVTTKDFENKPTLEDVKEWFRTEHKIHICMTNYYNEHWYWEYMAFTDFTDTELINKIYHINRIRKLSDIKQTSDYDISLENAIILLVNDYTTKKIKLN